MSPEAIITTVLAILLAVLGWNGSQAHRRLDRMEESMNALMRSMPHQCLGKADFRSSEERMEKRVEKIERAIDDGFTDFWKKFDRVIEGILNKIDTKKDKE